jgi:EAL domain-containing protein (putative c-di-GMP-specific phosphodiesterase class I)
MNLGFGTDTLVVDSISLHKALRRGWVEFWYQPKINLRRQEVVGVEAFARVRLPTAAILSPAAFLPGADKDSLTALSELALINALETSLKLSKLGINLQIAVNVPADCLRTLPIGKIVRAFRTESANWPGLILDMTEDQIIDDIPFVGQSASTLRPYRVKVAVDNFGRHLWKLMQSPDGTLTKETINKALDIVIELKKVSFAEMKLEQAVVTECGTGSRNADFCQAVIDLAHNFGGRAVAMGVERQPDVDVLRRMNCDVGQGSIFTPPVSQQDFIVLMQDRVARRSMLAFAG